MACLALLMWWRVSLGSVHIMWGLSGKMPIKSPTQLFGEREKLSLQTCEPQEAKSANARVSADVEEGRRQFPGRSPPPMAITGWICVG